MRLRRAGDGAVPSAVGDRSRQGTGPVGADAVVPPGDAPVGPHEHRGAGTEPVPRRECRPVHVPALDQHPQRHGPDGGGRPRPRSAVRAGEQREAALEEVECRAVAPRVPDPGVWGALARPRGEIDAQVRRRVGAGDHRRAVRVAQAARQAVGRAALHVERAGGGGEPGGAAFRVVAREQRVPGQAAGRPRELPAQLVAVVDRGVQTDPGDGGGPVRGVADEEPGPGAVGRRDLGRQRERLHVEDFGIEVGTPGGGAQRRRPVGGHGRWGSVEPQADVGPAALAHRAQRRAVRLVDKGEDALRLRQGRAGSEQHLDGVSPGAQVGGGDAECGADGAAGAVGPDDEAGVDPPGAELGADAVGAHVQGQRAGSRTGSPRPPGARRRRGPVRGGPAGRPAAARG